MSDMSTLILNNVRNTMESLNKNGVGFINCEYSDSIQYQIDGRLFDITVKEVERLEELDR